MKRQGFPSNPIEIQELCMSTQDMAFVVKSLTLRKAQDCTWVLNTQSSDQLADKDFPLV